MVPIVIQRKIIGNLSNTIEIPVIIDSQAKIEPNDKKDKPDSMETIVSNDEHIEVEPPPISNFLLKDLATVKSSYPRFYFWSDKKILNQINNFWLVKEKHILE